MGRLDRNATSFRPSDLNIKPLKFNGLAGGILVHMVLEKTNQKPGVVQKTGQLI